MSARVPRWRRRAVNVAALRAGARRALPRAVFDFVDGGAGDEGTLRRNEATFDSLPLLPRPLNGAAGRDLSVTLFGRRLSLPLVVAPTGLAGLLWPDGEAAAARAAAAAGSAYCLSHGSVCTLEALAETGAPRWMQTYIYKDRALTREMARRAAAAGYEALVVTVDTQLLGNRERDLRNGFVIPPRLAAGEVARMAFKLPWLLRMRKAGDPPDHLRQLQTGGRARRPHRPRRAHGDASRPRHDLAGRGRAARSVAGAAAAQGHPAPGRGRRGGGQRSRRGDRLQPRRAAAGRRRGVGRGAAGGRRGGGRARDGPPRRRHQAGRPRRQGVGARRARLAWSGGRSSGGWRSRARPAWPTCSTSSAAKSTSPWASAGFRASPKSAPTSWTAARRASPRERAPGRS